MKLIPLLLEKFLTKTKDITLDSNCTNKASNKKSIIDILDDPIFYLPKRLDNTSMINYLQEHFEKYLCLLDNISEQHVRRTINPIKPKISRFCHAIIEAINAQFEGNPARSYEIFDAGLSPLKPFLLFDRNGGQPKEYIRQRKYYRMRKEPNAPSSKEEMPKEPSVPYSKGEMFHPPFSKRSIVTNQRYSIAGLPCLYLASSVYVCWKEIDKPEINKTQVCRFEQDDINLKILDLDLTPHRLQTQLKSFNRSFMDTRSRAHKIYFDLAMSTVVNWPLLIACSLQVDNRSVPFKQEYIIPQLLLQWIMRQKDIAGIRYFSNKATQFPTSVHFNHSNFVFPPKKMNGEYCEDLCRYFKMTDPLPIATLNISGISEEMIHAKEKSDTQTVEDSNTIYDDKIFEQIESATSHLNTEHLNHKNQ